MALGWWSICWWKIKVPLTGYVMFGLYVAIFYLGFLPVHTLALTSVCVSIAEAISEIPTLLSWYLILLGYATGSLPLFRYLCDRVVLFLYPTSLGFITILQT